jgi:hypothetical protein
MMQTESQQQVWSARVQEQAASGLGIRVGWGARGLTEATLYYSRKRLSAPTHGFVRRGTDYLGNSDSKQCNFLAQYALNQFAH